MIILPYFIAAVNFAILLINRVKPAILLLLAQYVLAFLISFPVLPLRTLLARLIGGILVSAILFTSALRYQSNSHYAVEGPTPRSVWLRSVTSLITVIVAWALGTQNQAIPASINAAIYLGSIFNMCMGSLMVGLYQSPLEAAIGLLTLLIGFDLFYGGIEPSLAIVVLLISLQLIISLATSYILNVTQAYRESTEADS